VFEFLFKYRPVFFEQGHFALGAPASVRLWLIAAAVSGAAAVATYTLARGRVRVLDRGVMAALRVALLGVLLFCLLQPVLVLSTVVPQQNFVGVLVDDSRSMSLANADGTVRSDFVSSAFAPGQSDLLQKLSDRFTLRFFRFSSSTSRIDGPAELTYEGTHTDLADALDAARQELSGLPLSGLVMVTDGADNGNRPLADALVSLQAAGVPVFTVGVGDEEVSPDIELGRVEVPRSILAGSDLVVDVVVTQTGMRRATVPLIVEDDQRILTQENVTLGSDGEPVVARVRFHLDEPGPRRIRFRIPPQPGERVDRNNAREVQIDVRAEREKILYFEGEPRFEVKFMRRAVEDDDNIQLVVLQRTAESKFLRLAVDSADELVAGFPKTRAELDSYRGLVLGSVEASFFTHDQLQMIADFVSERGGGVLFLGGHNAFAEGGWAGTPVEEVMPVVLGTPAPAFFSEVKVAPTPAGLAHPAVQLGSEDSDPSQRWDSLPPITVVNRISEVKPGATTLLTGPVQGGGGQIILAHQRYGRGKAIAFTPQDSWLWQMSAQVPVDDQSYEAFWQQMLRWLVDGVPRPVTVTLDHERAERGEPVRVTAMVADSSYLEVDDATVVARITSPSGGVSQVPAEWTVDRDGEYVAQFVPTEEGEYEVDVSASRDGHTLGSDGGFVRTAPSDDEFFGAGRRTRTLQRIAEETGGRFYTPDDVASLPEDISVTGAGVTLVEEKDLWDMPVLFLLIVLLMGLEWGYRRTRGLV